MTAASPFNQFATPSLLPCLLSVHYDLENASLMTDMIGLHNVMADACRELEEKGLVLPPTVNPPLRDVIHQKRAQLPAIRNAGDVRELSAQALERLQQALHLVGTMIEERPVYGSCMPAYKLVDMYPSDRLKNCRKIMDHLETAYAIKRHCNAWRRDQRSKPGAKC